MHKYDIMNNEFIKKMENAAELGYYKYGGWSKNVGEGRVDAIATLEKCLEAYKKDKNTEHLIDVANYAMAAFTFPLPGYEYRPTDSDGSVGTIGTPYNFEKEY